MGSGSLTFGLVSGSIRLRGTGGPDSCHLTITMVGPLGGPYRYSGEVLVDSGN